MGTNADKRAGGAEKDYQITAILRALDVLELIVSENSMRLTDVADRLGLAQSTAFRYLWNLQRRGYVTLFPDGTYRQGPKLLRLGSRAAEPWKSVIELSRGVRLALRDESKETVNFGALHGARVLLLEVMSSRQALRVSPEPGTGGYLHSTAMGKAILSCLHDRDIAKLLEADGLPRLTDHTIVDLGNLLEDVASVRRRGWAVDNEESLEGLRCVAAPIPGPGSVITAVSIEAPISRMSDDDVTRFGRMLVKARDSLERAFAELEEGVLLTSP